jgi:hypothetical protein
MFGHVIPTSVARKGRKGVGQQRSRKGKRAGGSVRCPHGPRHRGPSRSQRRNRSAPYIQDTPDRQLLPIRDWAHLPSSWRPASLRGWRGWYRSQRYTLQRIDSRFFNAFRSFAVVGSEPVFVSGWSPRAAALLGWAGATIWAGRQTDVDAGAGLVPVCDVSPVEIYQTSSA